MANLPPLYPRPHQFVASGAPIAAQVVTEDENKITAEQLVLNICNPELREEALRLLTKKREDFQNLAVLLWNSFGTITALLQEIVSIYPLLSPPTLSPKQSERACNALVLLQYVATNVDTKTQFLSAQFPLYLYPFLNTPYKTKEYDFLRLTSLGVIGALVKDGDHEVVTFLLGSEIIPLCLRTMEIGGDLSKTVATYILDKIVRDSSGLNYVCASSERCLAVVSVLALMVESPEHPSPSPRLLRHIIHCFLVLTENSRACTLLYRYLPISLTNGTLSLTDVSLTDGTLNKEHQDESIQWLRQMLHNVNTASNGIPWITY